MGETNFLKADGLALADDRLIGLGRIALAASTLLIIAVDPSEPDRFVAATYGALVGYLAYAIIVRLVQSGLPRTWQSWRKWSHWGDVAWCSVLVSLSNGTNSIFFFGFFFPILIASFRWGLAAGCRVTLACAGFFALLGVTVGPDPEFDLNRFLLRPTYLLLFGFMISRWGGREITLKKRISLLSSITMLSNPRLGVERVLAAALSDLSAFYRAEQCWIVLRVAGASEFRAQRLASSQPQVALTQQPLDPELASALLAIPQNLSVLYHSRFGWANSRVAYFAHDVDTGARSTTGREEASQVAARLGAAVLLSAPVRWLEEEGRLFVVDCRSAVAASDAAFLWQVVTQLSPLVERIELIDKLTLSAAQEERRRIARDIHDSVIQPYIGLQIGLQAIQDKLDAGQPVRPELERLRQMARSSIEDLRGYVSGLKAPREQREMFLAALRRYVTRFSELTSIRVQVEVDQSLEVGPRLAAEVFQLVVEGLSNVRRHTRAAEAAIRLTCDRRNLLLEISNQELDEPQGFVPKSLSERAEALGGRLRVVPAMGKGQTMVSIEIPL